MKSRCKMIGLALVVLVAVTATSASTALAAAPEFKPAHPTKPKFTAKSGAFILRVSNKKITCSASTSSGEISGPTTAGKVVDAFTGCSGQTGTEAECKVHSTGEPNGTIRTNELTGVLGITTTGSKVGLKLKPASGTEVMFLEPEAGKSCIFATEVTKSIIGELGPIGKAQTTSELAYAEAKEKQAIKEIEIEGIREEATLRCFGAEMRWTGKEEITFEEPIEVT
jgi:hypothetical protein